MPKQLPHLFEFGRFRLDRTDRLLFQDGVPLSLPPKLFDTLLILAENPSHVVEKDDHLMQKIWAPNHRRMGRLRGQLQPGRYGHAPLRAAHRRALSERTDLSRLCACSAEEVCLPISRRMLASHERSLGAARGHQRTCWTD